MILNENWLILGGSPKEYEVTMKWLRHRCITRQTLLTRNAFTEPHNHQVVSNTTTFITANLSSIQNGQMAAVVTFCLIPPG